MKNRNVLVTGGAGFIGSALIKEISDQNNVTSVDNYFTGSKSNHHPGVRYVEEDAGNINKIFAKESFDIIYHLGEYSRVESSYEDYSLVEKFNILSFPNILNFAKKLDAKIVYSGSSTKFAEYSENDYHSPYAWSKLRNTEYLKHYAKWFGLKYAISYFYNVYGEGELSEGNYSTVVGKFLRLAQEGSNHLPVVSPGTQKRNFTHIKDTISALVLIGEKGEGDGYGIGAEESFSIIELAELIGIAPKMIETRKGNRMSGSLETQKTEMLGWKSKRKLVDYIRKHLNQD